MGERVRKVAKWVLNYPISIIPLPPSCLGLTSGEFESAVKII